MHIEEAFVVRKRKPNQCSTCGGYGHNKARCSQPAKATTSNLAPKAPATDGQPRIKRGMPPKNQLAKGKLVSLTSQKLGTSSKKSNSILQNSIKEEKDTTTKGKAAPNKSKQPKDVPSMKKQMSNVQVS